MSGLAAKEVVISTMGVLYSLGGEVDETSSALMETIKNTIPLKVAIGYILFIMIYNPCLAATVVFGKEAGGFKYIVYLFLMTTFVASFAVIMGLLFLVFFFYSLKSQKALFWVSVSVFYSPLTLPAN